MTVETDHRSAQISYVIRQLKTAARRLEMINLELTKRGHNAQLAAECEALAARIANLEASLKTLKGEAA